MGVFDLFGKEPRVKHTKTEREELTELKPLEEATKGPVSVFSPTEYRDVEKIIDNLRSGKTCVVHLTELKTETAIRILDMLSGAVYALGGGIYEMQKNTFMFSPSGVEVN